MKYGVLLITLFLLTACANTNKQAAHYNAELGILYTQEGAYDKARINAFKALEFDPKSEEAHYAVAFYAQKTKQTALAQEHYLAALHLNPKSGQLNDSYALFLCEQGQYQQALKHFDTAAQDVTYAKVSDIYEHAGNCALEIPNQALADSYFLKSYDHKPNS
jgi:type IV pilus assembly protein PilF